jgi:hypothetical protein
MKKFGHLSALGLCIFLLSCSTISKNVETPTGPQPGDQFGNMTILGFSNKGTASLNRSNAKDNGPTLGFAEDVTIDVPVGTQFIVPAVTGWRLNYGGIDPNTEAAHLDTDPNVHPKWKTEDHNWGMGQVNVSVKDVNAPDMSATPPKQTATIHISLILSDENGDDSWSGTVFYSLLYLGKTSNTGPMRDRPIPR